MVGVLILLNSLYYLNAMASDTALLKIMIDDREIPSMLLIKGMSSTIDGIHIFTFVIYIASLGQIKHPFGEREHTLLFTTVGVQR